MTPEEWLEHGLALKWPDGIPRGDYARVVELVGTLGSTLSAPRRQVAAQPKPLPKPPLKGKQKSGLHTNQMFQHLMELLQRGEWSFAELTQRVGYRHSASLSQALKKLKAKEVSGLPRGNPARRYTLAPTLTNGTGPEAHA